MTKQFYYLIDLHYSQTTAVCDYIHFLVLLPYRFTLFSNLYYNQRKEIKVLLPYRFTLFSNQSVLFSSKIFVLLPYRFTLFSNFRYIVIINFFVLLPYRFTLFSNKIYATFPNLKVLLPYRFTLFSNLKLRIKCTHYTVHGKSMRIFYNICIMIVNKIRTNHYQSQQVFRIQKLLSALSFQC